mmetsp:Transcript_9581/g.27319  ORF Transcript_9581/g.27319 Transcript_9581/m.27319 type:complete len:315 (+) Transcript_9581:392-1336(+)
MWTDGTGNFVVAGCDDVSDRRIIGDAIFHLVVFIIVLVHRAAAHEVRGRHAVLVARVLDLARAQIEREDGQRIRILVGNQQVLPGMIELKMARRFSAGVEMSHHIQPTALHDLVHADGLVSAVADDDEPSRLMDADSAARVEGVGKGVGDGADGLDQSQRAAPAESFQAVFAVAHGGVDFLQQVAVDLKDGDRRTELVDDVRDVVARMEFQVPRSVGMSGAQSGWQHVHLAFDLAVLAVVQEFANDVLAQIRYIRDGSDKGIQHERMRMRIGLALLDGGSVVAGMVDAAVLLGGRDHLFASLGIVHGFDLGVQE